ncbi:CDP-glucose 4,6-dehydratase [Paenibacillus sp. FSL R7-0297]|uniref:CDP-glucose 4,6-dehydratase n=1 Tax=Paenibacillus sp. FSL R7-0297 TaxID=2921680 RepID=UPI0030F549EA
MGNLGLIDRGFWNNKRVFLTGHTGFKGSWLSIWLHNMGASVTGYSLIAPTVPSLFEVCNVGGLITKSIIGDIMDTERLKSSMHEADPEIVIHMAAQPLVRLSYQNPVLTYSTNVMGTVNLFEAVRICDSVHAVLNVTTDKCYINQEWELGYRENDPLGGYDPYSSSKACSEIITSAYRNSFFEANSIAVGTARAGNVIGWGDWAQDRLIPDLIRSFSSGTEVLIRQPDAVRPWQHVLEPLSGYLTLAQKLYENGGEYADAWNFGPIDSEAKSVLWIVEEMTKRWPYKQPEYKICSMQDQLHEAKTLILDCSKARNRLGWSPRWSLSKALDYTIQGVTAFLENEDLRELCERQIMEYEHS